LRAGAAHLAADFEAAWRAAHSRYNTGDPQRGIANGYAGRIERAMGATVSAFTAPASRPAQESEPDSWDVWATPPSRASSRGQASPAAASEATAAGASPPQSRLVVELR
jgi:type IV secretion system protein VirB1